MSDLLKIARALSPEQQWQAYRKARVTPGSEQLAGALEIANPQVKLRHMTEHPTPGKLVSVVTREGGRDVTRYYGDARSWRRQFEASAIPCSMERPQR